MRGDAVAGERHTANRGRRSITRRRHEGREVMGRGGQLGSVRGGVVYSWEEGGDC